MSYQDKNELLTPKIDNINISFGGSKVSSKEDIMNEDDIEQLILSQVPKVSPPVLPSPEQASIAQDNKPEIQNDLNSPPDNLEDNKSKNAQNIPDNIIIDFDIDSMNNNLNAITTDAKKRIIDLDKKQKLLDSRIGLIEKFILLDEKDLAKELVKEKVNLTSVGQIQKSITNRTELLSQILDISLKYEDTIIKWNKTMMDIEKDKVSAYQKIKGINKETKIMDDDINSVLNTINTFVKENPSILEDAKNELNIKGYGGQTFNS